MSRRRPPAPPALRLLHRLAGSTRARRRKSGRSTRSIYATGSSSRLRHSHKPSLLLKHRAPIGFTVFLLLLGAVNLYVLYYRHDTSVPALLELASAGRRAALQTHTRLIGPPGTPPVPVRSNRRSAAFHELPDYPRVVEIPLKVGDTVPAVLRSHAVTGALGEELQSSLRSLLDPGGLGAGQSFTLYYDLDDRLAALDYRLTDSSAFHLERVATGSTERFVSSRKEQPQSRQVASIAIVIERDGDLLGAVTRAGEHPALASRLGELFACEMSAFADTQAGDRFRILVEKLLLGGNFYRYGRLLAAEFQPAVRPASPARPGRSERTLRAFLNPSLANSQSVGSAGAAPGSAVHYFSESGDSVARALCRSPLLYGKAPSTFDFAANRPVLHSERGHLGIEYPAPAGTPVVAAGAGKVTSILHAHGHAGQSSAFGNTVIISHPGGLETTYQNLGRLARGLNEGQPVRLRQIIGYLGQPGAPLRNSHAGHAGPTPRPPRPHLYFALKSAGKLVDPTKWKSPREPGLPTPQRAAFSEQVADWMERLASAAVPAAAPGPRVATTQPPQPSHPGTP